MGLAVKQLTWGSQYHLLGVNTVREVFILREHQISAHYNDTITAIQTSPTKISVFLDSEKQDQDSVSVLTSDIQLRGIFVPELHLLLQSSLEVGVVGSVVRMTRYSSILSLKLLSEAPTVSFSPSSRFETFIILQ